MANSPDKELVQARVAHELLHGKKKRKYHVNSDDTPSIIKGGGLCVCQYTAPHHDDMEQSAFSCSQFLLCPFAAAPAPGHVEQRELNAAGGANGLRFLTGLDQDL